MKTNTTNTKLKISNGKYVVIGSESQVAMTEMRGSLNRARGFDFMKPKATDLDHRLRSHISMMAPHQTERRGGKLLIEAAEKILELELALFNLMPFVLDDYYEECATDEWKSAVQAAFRLTPEPEISPSQTVGLETIGRDEDARPVV